MISKWSWIRNGFLALAGVTVFSVSAHSATIYATDVLDSTVGTEQVAPNSNRTNEGNALGTPDGIASGNTFSGFFSLGLGGSAVFSFGQAFIGPAIVFEITGGNPSTYPESVDLYVGIGNTWSLDYTDTALWSLAGSITNVAAQGGGTVGFAGGPFQYLLLHDTSGAPSTDGFDVDAISVSSVPLPAAAWLFGSALLGLVAVARRKAAV